MQITPRTSGDDASNNFATRLPSSEFMLFETDSLNMAKNRLTTEFAPHQIDLKNKSNFFRTTAYKGQVADTSLYRIRYCSDVTICSAPLRSYYLLYLPITGRIRVESDGQKTDVLPGEIIVVNPFNSYTLHKMDDSVQLTLKFDRTKLEIYLNALLGHSPMGPISFESDQALKYRNCENLIRIISLVEADLFAGPGMYKDEVSGRIAEKLLLDMLLRQVPNNYSKNLFISQSSLAPYYVKKALDYIHENAHHHITMLNLAALSDISERALYDGFRNFRNTSPMAYVKNIRLDRVRAELIGIRCGATQRRKITEIAGDWCFSHMGNFSKDYKQKFGETPTNTMSEN
jgi:AraC-like DNA-binding protein